LINEFPEYKEDITVKNGRCSLQKLYDEYNHLTKEVEKREQEIVPSTTLEEEKLKKQRLQLKDTLSRLY